MEKGQVKFSGPTPSCSSAMTSRAVFLGVDS